MCCFRLDANYRFLTETTRKEKKKNHEICHWTYYSGHTEWSSHLVSCANRTKLANKLVQSSQGEEKMSVECPYTFIVGDRIVRVVLELNEPSDFGWKYKNHTFQSVIRTAFQQWEPYRTGRMPEGTRGQFFATSLEEQIRTTWVTHEERLTWRQWLLSLGNTFVITFPDLPRFTVLEINFESCRDPVRIQRQVRSG